MIARILVALFITFGWVAPPAAAMTASAPPPARAPADTSPGAGQTASPAPDSGEKERKHARPRIESIDASKIKPESGGEQDKSGSK